MTWRAKILGFIVVACLASAPVFGAGWTDKGRKLLDALVTIECAMGADQLTQLQRDILARARREGVIPAYSEGLCIERDIVPSTLMDGGRKS